MKWMLISESNSFVGIVIKWKYSWKNSIDFTHKSNCLKHEKHEVDKYPGSDAMLRALLFFEMSDLIWGLGFKSYSLENGFYNNMSGQLLQVDGIFIKD